MEHLQHFDLQKDPFRIEPDLRIYFDSPSHRDAQCRVERGLRQSKGLTVLTGEDGTGKTLLARRILNQLEEEVFEANLMVMLPGAAGAGAVLQRFARQLGAEDAPEDRAALMVEIYDRLAAVREEGRHSVLILDDAQLLGPEPMAEIGGLLNLEYEDRRLLSILLVGLPQLDHPLLEEAGLDQRVDVRVRLQPLDLETSAAYLEHRLETAGGRPDILSPEAVASLFELGGGRPRLMNTLADNALFEAFLAKRAQIGAGEVKRAAQDLGIGPATQPAPAPPPASREIPVSEASALAELTIPDTSSDIEVEGLDFEDVDDLSTLLVTGEDENGASSTVDLDDEVIAVLGEADPLPTFEARNSSQATGAAATRLALPEDGPPKDEDDELDELFVELIED